MTTSLPKTSAPASRALAGIGVTSLEDLTKHSESELLALHGMGPKAIRILKKSMQSVGIAFKK